MIKDIGNTLKECRSRAKISVKEISDLLTNKGYKASESTIYSWENGNSQPTPGALLTMCQAYGIDDVLSTFGYNGYKEAKGVNDRLPRLLFLRVNRSQHGHGEVLLIRWRVGFQMGQVFFQVGNHFPLPFDCLGEELNQLVLQGVALALMAGLQQL